MSNSKRVLSYEGMLPDWHLGERWATVGGRNGIKGASRWLLDGLRCLRSGEREVLPWIPQADELVEYLLDPCLESALLVSVIVVGWQAREICLLAH